MTAGESSGAERPTEPDGVPGADAMPPGGSLGRADGQTPAQARAAALDELAARPLAEHPDGYERLHADLRAALAEIDDAGH